MKALIVIFLIQSTSLFAQASKRTSKEDFELYKRNSQILGLVAGETPLTLVYEVLGRNEFKRPKKSHDFVSFCYKSTNSKIFLIIETGYLHDYQTMHGFEFTSKLRGRDKSKCKASPKLEGLQTLDGIGPLVEKSEVIKILGKATQIKVAEHKWDFEYHEVYNTPVVTRSEAGPTDARYVMVHSAHGAFHYPSITAKFVGDKLESYKVDSASEADFKITHEPIAK